jgi:hypothetical protein
MKPQIAVLVEGATPNIVIQIWLAESIVAA